LDMGSQAHDGGGPRISSPTRGDKERGVACSKSV
jgi:hypothetical protein